MCVFPFFFSSLGLFFATGPELPASATIEPHLSPPPPHLRHVLRSTRRESWGTLRDASPDAWGPPPPATATAVPSAPPLTRQPSIRRVPARSRTVDFTDFTSRRRSSGREGNNNSATAGDAEADDSAAQTTSPFPPLNAMGMPPRRFFPSRRPELPWSPLPESTSSSPSTGTGTGTATGAGAMPSTRSSPAPVPVSAPAPPPPPPAPATHRPAQPSARNAPPAPRWRASARVVAAPSTRDAVAHGVARAAERGGRRGADGGQCVVSGVFGPAAWVVVARACRIIKLTE